MIGGSTEELLIRVVALHISLPSVSLPKGHRYSRVSGDNKSYAAQLFEEQNSGIIAAFATAHCGDVSPNVALPKKEFEGYEARMVQFGTAQYQAAQNLYNEVSESLGGAAVPVDVRFQLVDMSCYRITPGPKSGESTSPATVGLGWFASTFSLRYPRVTRISTSICRESGRRGSVH